MATSQQFLVADNSTLANLKAWASAIGAALATFGWVQQPDTGQVVWTATVLTLTQVAVSGGNAVYSYSSYTGPAPRVGMSVIITGFTIGGNNVTGNLIAVSGGASGTVTMATTTQANETHAGSGTTTAQASIPSASYVYEIWAPGDALQTGGTVYYVKFEYGSSSGTANVSFRYTVGTATNGAGNLVLSGYFIGPVLLFTFGHQGGTPYECNFSGDSGRFAMMLWRNGPSSITAFLGFERTLATDGTPSTDGMTAIQSRGAGGDNPPAGWDYAQGNRTLVFGVGWAPGYYPQILGSPVAATQSFNNKTPLSPVFPIYGIIGNPQTIAGSLRTNDAPEGGLVPTTFYGATRIYLISNAGNLVNFGNGGTVHRLAMRYD